MSLFIAPPLPQFDPAQNILTLGPFYTREATGPPAWRTGQGASTGEFARYATVGQPLSAERDAALEPEARQQPVGVRPGCLKLQAGGLDLVRVSGLERVDERL